MKARIMMRSMSTTYFSSLLVLLLFLYFQNLSYSTQAQVPGGGILGFRCSLTQASYPCQTYIHFRAMIPDYLDLAAVGDLFSVSRRMIAEPSKISISDVTFPLLLDQSLFIPINCGCNFINATFGNISYAGINYTFLSGDTYWKVSTQYYQNLTTYQSAEVVNPDVEPTNIDVGASPLFPIFCMCPNSTQLQNRSNYLITYVFHPQDDLTSLASRFGTTPEAIVGINGNNISPFDPIFVPVSSIPL